ncbi:uncharacterized protein DNG_09139 [Cephalotrichum gorgonifer]|uniref:Rhodopsin domain-containing protein n=1 Tax=Cephalotrichum gorgonifer TaxID=2041049 RepID=A0AAE8SZ31_9PEZI|nr:uncharacterized protein DNG_09139 [Cephalotrichum gorgonifer]
MAVHKLWPRTPENPEFPSLGPHLNRVIWALAGLAALFLALRIYCKLWRGRKLWWDDYALIASWVALASSTSLQSVGVTYGLGMHSVDLGEESISNMSLYSMCAGFASILAATWSKSSFAISLLRITNGRTRVFVWFILISVNLIMAANGTIQWVQCWPVSKRWHWEIEGSCWPGDVVQKYNAFVAAYSGSMDIVLALLPWKIIWFGTINKKEKLGALLAMSLGIFAGVVSFLKIRTLYVIGDDTQTTVDLFIFGTAEPATAIMAASMPVLRLLFDQNKPQPARFVELSDKGRLAKASPRAKSAGYEGTLLVWNPDDVNDATYVVGPPGRVECRV